MTTSNANLIVGSTMLNISATPYYTASSITPMDVSNYLSREGWSRSTDGQERWGSSMSNGVQMTWEQALIYTGFKKLNLLP